MLQRLSRNAIKVSSLSLSLLSSSRIGSNDNFQGWYRKESIDERHRLMLSMFLNELYEDRLASSTSSSTPSSSTPSSSIPSSSTPSSTSSIYNRYHDTLDHNNFTRYLNDCLNTTTIVDEEVLHNSIIISERILHDRHNVSVIPSTVEKVIIVGDLHGDLASLSYIFQKYGVPSEKMAYVFNGMITCILIIIVIKPSISLLLLLSS